MAHGEVDLTAGIDDVEAFATAGRVEAFDRAAVRRHIRRAS